jgi:CRISPR-associated endonuclease Csn1
LIKYFSLNKKYEKVKIIPNKPLNTSYLREKLDLPKNRKIDDLHHAEDAYLNIISGKVIDDKYGDSLKKKG